MSIDTFVPEQQTEGHVTPCEGCLLNTLVDPSEAGLTGHCPGPLMKGELSTYDRLTPEQREKIDAIRSRQENYQPVLDESICRDLAAFVLMGKSAAKRSKR